jgi:hypothetical protein
MKIVEKSVCSFMPDNETTFVPQNGIKSNCVRSTSAKRETPGAKRFVIPFNIKGLKTKGDAKRFPHGQDVRGTLRPTPSNAMGRKKSGGIDSGIGGPVA